MGTDITYWPEPGCYWTYWVLSLPCRAKKCPPEIELCKLIAFLGVLAWVGYPPVTLSSLALYIGMIYPRRLLLVIFGSWSHLDAIGSYTIHPLLISCLSFIKISRPGEEQKTHLVFSMWNAKQWGLHTWYRLAPVDPIRLKRTLHGTNRRPNLLTVSPIRVVPLASP